MVVNPRFSQPLLPYTSRPSGVKVRAWITMARPISHMPVRFHAMAGMTMAPNAKNRPIMQNMPWLSSCRNGDLPCDAIVTVELENTMIRPKQVRPTTAVRKPW